MTTIKRSFEMFNPPHPGEVLRELYLKPLGLTVTQTAKLLDVTRKNLSDLLNGHIGVSPTMAMRLSLATHTSAESWLNKQVAHDLWEAKQKVKQLRRHVKPLKSKAA
jgi:addiction module HigA family antidote